MKPYNQPCSLFSSVNYVEIFVSSALRQCQRMWLQQKLLPRQSTCTVGASNQGLTGFAQYAMLNECRSTPLARAQR